MKKFNNITFILFIITFFTGCISENWDEKIIETEEGDVQINIFATMPDAPNSLIDTRGSYPQEATNEAKIDNLKVLVFENDGDMAQLLQFADVTLTGVDKGIVTLTAINGVHLRLVANHNLSGLSNGQTWQSIRASHSFEINNGTAGKTQTFPMIGEKGNFNIRYGATIGTSTNPIKLTRALSKITILISDNGLFKYEGNKVCNILNRGYLFEQSEISSYPGATITNESIFSKNTVTYSPERKNTAGNNKTPLSDRTFVVIQGKFDDVTSFYRVDFGSHKQAPLQPTNSTEMEYVDFERNTNYLLDIKIKGYGYSTEAEAIKSPINANVVEVSITEGDAYEFIVDEQGSYLGLSNSEVYIFGKSKYIKNGFSGTPEPYLYVLATLTNEKTEGWSDNDIKVIGTGLTPSPQIKVVDKYDEEGNKIPGMKEYLLLANIQSLDNDGNWASTTVTLRYGRLVQKITITKFDYIDCHYGRQHLGFDNSIIKIRKSRVDDGGFFEGSLDWIMLRQDENNCATTDIGNSQNQYLEGSVNPSLCYKEHVDGNKMGVRASENAKNEGFRFADVFCTNKTDNHRIKIIIAQANADLSGFFGHDQLIAKYNTNDITGNYDDTGVYNKYLVVERLNSFLDEQPNSLNEYLEKINPRDKTLWYIPTYKQLLGLWVTDNSNSRRTSPFQNQETQASSYTYFCRLNFSETHIKNYSRSNETGMGQAVQPANMPFISFLYGETNRGQNANMNIFHSIRAVRNLDVEPSGLGTSTSPVSGNTITMDPKNYLSEDYFRNLQWNDPDVKSNNVARKFQVSASKVGNQNIYKWTWTTGANYNRDVRNNQEGEFTWGDSKTGASSVGSGYRLPTMRELNLIYIYKETLEKSSGFYKFNKDEPDASSVSNNVNQISKYPLIMRFPAVTGKWAAPYYWYWSSTYKDIDGGQPLRMSMDLGIVNRRGGENIADQKSQLDHYRPVSTVVAY